MSELEQDGMAGDRPELLSRGTYAIYSTPKGAMVVSYRVEGSEEDGHLDVPAPLVSMARRMAAGEGGPAMGSGLMARFMGMRQS